MSATPFVLPLIPSPQTLTIPLNGVLYQLTLHWCDPAQCWILDIADNSGNPLVQGIAVVTGADLLEQFGYLNFGGQLIAQTDNNADEVPTFNNLGSTGNLFFVTGA